MADFFTTVSTGLGTWLGTTVDVAGAILGALVASLTIGGILLVKKAGKKRYARAH